MRIVCPECHAAYQVGAMIKNAILVCHRCNTEFDSYGNKIVEESEISQILSQQQSVAPTFGIHELKQAGLQKHHAHIWVWMSLVLLALSAAGLVWHWPTWQYHADIRGYLVGTQPQQTVLDRDWLILPESVHSQWLVRDDKSIVLIIEGKVRNQLNTPLPAPEIQISFNTQTGQDYTLIQAITEPPSLSTLQASPFISPPVDSTRIRSLGERGFILLIKDTPRSSQQFVMHALAVQRRGQTNL